LRNEREKKEKSPANLYPESLYWFWGERGAYGRVIARECYNLG